jgi:hypothetical protein
MSVSLFKCELAYTGAKYPFAGCSPHYTLNKQPFQQEDLTSNQPSLHIQPQHDVQLQPICETNFVKTSSAMLTNMTTVRTITLVYPFTFATVTTYFNIQLTFNYTNCFTLLVTANSTIFYYTTLLFKAQSALPKPQRHCHT